MWRLVLGEGNRNEDELMLLTEFLWGTERKTLDNWKDICLQKSLSTGLRRFRFLFCARYAEPLKVWRADINVINQQDEPVSDLQIKLE